MSLPLVTEEEVHEIIDIDSSVTSIDPFITVAHLIVENVIGSSPIMTNEMLKEVERWLSAHFVCIRDPRATSEGANGLSISYEGQPGKFLQSTRYGQQACLLDLSGSLANLGKTPVRFNVINAALGTPQSAIPSWLREYMAQGGVIHTKRSAEVEPNDEVMVRSIG